MTYPSDLNEKHWALIKDHVNTGNYGKSGKYNQSILVKGVFYVMKIGCPWEFLPKAYPSWKTVYNFYKRAKDRGWSENMMRDLVRKSDINMGRKPDPSYSLMDSQSIKTRDKAHERGIDGGKTR